MTQWYCHIGGQQYGPIDQDVLAQWVRDGRLSLNDSVWSDGMTDWQPAGEALPGLFAAAPGAAPGTVPPPQQPGPGGQVRLMDVLPPGGTGGQTPNGQINTQARDVLRGRWGHAIGFCLLFWLLMEGIGMVVGPLVIVVAGVFQLGATIFFLTFIRGGFTKMGMMFNGWNDFGRPTCVYLLRELLVKVWLIPGVICEFVFLVKLCLPLLNQRQPDPEGMLPLAVATIVLLLLGAILAIYFYLRLSQVMYLIADEPGLGVKAVLRRSTDMMRGFKGKFFCLCLRYIGWGLLCVLPFYVGIALLTVAIVNRGLYELHFFWWSLPLTLLPCIGFIWLVPYMSCGLAKFYEDLRPPAGQPASAQMPAMQAG